MCGTLSPEGLRSFFFFNDTATTEIYTLSLHDALPICCAPPAPFVAPLVPRCALTSGPTDRKSTRLNSSHGYISHAVFCLKKKNKHPFRYPPHQRKTHAPHPHERHHPT